MRMRIRDFIAFVLCLAVVCPAWGEAVSESEARQIASSFMASHFKGSTNVRPQLAQRAPSVNAGATAPFYVFNASETDKGFVIVAGDDRVPQVLGYSDEGTFDYNDMPEALQEWLDGYAAQIAALDMGATMATHLTSSAPIAPMVKAEWSQNSPYYVLLPFRPNGQHALVGCVATAMAQVMHHWRWPNRPTKTIPAYVSKSLGYYMPELPPVDFAWNIMQNTYLTSDSLSDAGLAAATLSLYCAQSVEMDFKESASGAPTRSIRNALVHYFGYSPDIITLYHSHFTSEQWENIILDELRARRPIIYVGYKMTSGHAFICDGYDGNGMYHFNWGWNGKSNGYFLLNILNPDLQGSGSATGTYGYIMSQAVITGIQPGTVSHDRLDLYDEYIEIKQSVDTRTSVDQNFTVTQETHLLNCADESIDFNFAWGLYQDNNLVKVLNAGSKRDLPSWYYIAPTRTLSLGSGITSGTYRIIPLYSELNTENWRPCTGSDINYIEAVINDNHCTFICHGDAMTPDYQFNYVEVSGNMHPKRPVNITLNVTNRGYTRNDYIYMIADDQVVSVGFADVPNGETCDVALQYYPENTGSVTLEFALDEEGQNVIGSTTFYINPMPSASLTGSAQPLNVTDATNRIMTANEFAANVRVTNTSTTTYDEDITFTIYKNTYDNRGTAVQSATQHLTLEPNRSTILTFHMDNVTDGWKYFAYVYYYSAGEQTTLTSIGSHTIVFPAAVIIGDVNGDGEVNIGDINALINMILTGNSAPAGDVNNDGEVNIGDINATLDIILTSN